MFIFFFFKQKTAYEMRISDWSSDVCSSDLHSDVLDIEVAAFADRAYVARPIGRPYPRTHRGPERRELSSNVRTAPRTTGVADAICGPKVAASKYDIPVFGFGPGEKRPVGGRTGSAPFLMLEQPGFAFPPGGQTSPPTPSLH